MLVEFKVKNFKSIKDELVFSMERGEGTRATKRTKYNVLPKQNLLKSALVFGPNASGKSSFLEALFTLNALVVLEVRSVTQKLPYDSFGNSKEPTVFDITFIKNDTKYNYHIEYNAGKIFQERFSAKGKEVFNRLTTSHETLRENATLLFDYQEKNNQSAVEAYKWFSEDLIFEDSKFQLSDEVLFRVLEDATRKEKFVRILHYADFNISNVEVLELPLSKDEIEFANGYFEDEMQREMYLRSQRTLTLKLTHTCESIGTFNLVLSRESKGTQAAIRFILMLLSFESGKVLMVDEFDASFHLELSATFLSLINSEFQNNQFILTTHEAELMDYNMRRDQIYFTEKNINGETSMFSLYDFEQSDSRNDVKYSRKYRVGRFGAIPVISEDIILDILGDVHDKK